MEIQHNFSYQAFSCFRVDLTGDVSDDFFFFFRKWAVKNTDLWNGCSRQRINYSEVIKGRI